jgi:hypothetical protein
MLRDYRRRGLVRDGDEPPVLPFVLYTGPGRWRAKDGSEPRRGLPDGMAERLAPYQPQAYIPVEVALLATHRWPADSRFASAVRLAAPNPPDEVARRLWAELRRHPGPEKLEFRRGMHAWTEEMLGGPDSPIRLPPFEAMDGAEKEEMKYLHQDSVEAWGAPFVAKGREEGFEEGTVAGQRALLASLAESRFGADAARRLSGALNGTPSSRLMADAGALIVACGSAREFADRLGELPPD